MTSEVLKLHIRNFKQPRQVMTNRKKECGRIRNVILLMQYVLNVRNEAMTAFFVVPFMIRMRRRVYSILGRELLIVSDSVSPS